MINTGDPATSPATARLDVAGRASAFLGLSRGGSTGYPVFKVTQPGRHAPARGSRPHDTVGRARIAVAVAAAVPIGLIDTVAPAAIPTHVRDELGTVLGRAHRASDR
jgi:hypothetical protein